MLKYRNMLFFSVVGMLMLSMTVVAQEAPAGRGRAGAPGGRGAGMGMGMGRGGMAAPTPRPDKAARLEAIAELERQIAELKALIQKAPATDPNISNLTGEEQTNFTAQYTEESTALNQIITTINSLRPSAGGGRGGRGGSATGGLTTSVVTELIKLATEDRATKLVTRLEALVKQIEEENAIRRTEIVPGVIKLVPPASGASVNMYLVMGTEKAMLVDTAYPGDITPEDVEEITDLPYIVVNTHGHPDHVGSNNAFKQVYITEADMDMARGASGDAELLPMKEGDIFDLGGKTLEVIAVPGHSPGSVCLLIREDRLLISGDTANPNLLMNISNVPIEAFKRNMERLLDWQDQYDLLLPGHGGPFPVSYITDVISCAQEILDGEVDQTAQPAPAGGNFLMSGSSHRYGNITIRYNPDNLWENSDN